MIKLGSIVKDKVTGFEGIATGRVEYLTGCPRVCVEATKLEDGETKSQWFDEPRLTVLKSAG